jgi:3-hydroxyisobutyrate dehydrogenase
MGQPMAANLARAGFEVRAWNRSPAKIGPLAGANVVLASSPAEAADGADVVLTMLSDGDAVLAAMLGEQGALTEMSADSVWLQMSTIGETATARCAELAEPHLISFVDAPVLGSRGPAENRELITLASGPQQLRDRLQPVFDALSRKTIWLGPAGAGTRLKLVLNAWVLTVVEAGAELVALAEGFGLDPAMIFEALDGGPLDLPYLRMKAKAIAERDFQPAFRLALAAKDAELAEEAARQRGLELPLLTLLAERLALGAASYPDQDISATYLTLPSRGA